MPVRIQKSAVNIREKLAELERPIGVNGAALMATNTPQDAFSLIGARNRNLIINGGMVIDQRNNGGTLTSPNIGIAVDRWKCATYVTGTTIQRSTTAPPGFTNSYLMTNGTAVAPAQSTYYQQIWQTIEGLNMPQLAWGTSSAKPISVSFWVRSSVTGLYSFGIGNGNDNATAYTRSFVQTFTINAANTWEYKTFTIPGCTDGTWNTNNSYGMTIMFNLGSGTAYDTNTTVPGTWETIGNNIIKTSTASTIEFNNFTGATFYLTGVQLEEGKVATSFENRSYAHELTLCQRYYEKSFEDTVAPANGSTTTSFSTESGLTWGWAGHRTLYPAGGYPGRSVFARFKVPKRATPSVAIFGNSNGYPYIYDTTNGGRWVTANWGTSANKEGFEMSNEFASGAMQFAFSHWAAAAEL